MTKNRLLSLYVCMLNYLKIMIKIYIFIGFLLHHINLIAQDSSRVLLDANLTITQNIENASFSAAIIKQNGNYNATVYYGNEKVAFTGTYADKKLTLKHGFFTFYYVSTGRLMTTVPFEYNVPNGVTQSWYENGKLKDSGRKFYGHYIGLWSFWHNNGKLISRAKYADSLLTPISLKNFTKIEKPKIIMDYLDRNFPDDYKIGLWQTFYDNGQLQDSIYFDKGNKNGIFKSWYKNGKQKNVGANVNDLPVNTWNWYYNNGQKSTEEIYQKGKIISMKCFDSLGNFISDFCSISKPAIFPGGVYKFENYIKENVKYPEEVKKYKYNAVVDLIFTIDKNGKLKDVKFDATPTIYFNKEIERVLYQMPIWEPAIEHNIPVDYVVSLSVPMRYKL